MRICEVELVFMMEYDLIYKDIEGFRSFLRDALR
jgi:hypothetical protein